MRRSGLLMTEGMMSSWGLARQEEAAAASPAVSPAASAAGDSSFTSALAEPNPLTITIAAALRRTARSWLPC